MQFTLYATIQSGREFGVLARSVRVKLECNSGCSTRRNKYKLLNRTFTMIYENIISLHVSLIFGTVCQTTVVDVSTINQFKERLDKFWMHQDVLYDFTADLIGIGDIDQYMKQMMCSFVCSYVK